VVRAPLAILATPSLQQAALNGAAYWADIDVPVLTIYGDSDFITDAEDHRRIDSIVNSRKPWAASFSMINHMDHYLVSRPSQQASFDPIGAVRSHPECTVDIWLNLTTRLQSQIITITSS